MSVECRGTKAARGHRPWFNLQERWQQREEAFKFSAVLVLEPEPCTRRAAGQVLCGRCLCVHSLYDVWG